MAKFYAGYYFLVTRLFSAYRLEYSSTA